MDDMTEAELAGVCRLLGDPRRLRVVALLLDGEQPAGALDSIALAQLVAAGAARVEGGRARLTGASAELCGRLLAVALPAVWSSATRD